MSIVKKLVQLQRGSLELNFIRKFNFKLIFPFQSYNIIHFIIGRFVNQTLFVNNCSILVKLNRPTGGLRRIICEFCRVRDVNTVKYGVTELDEVQDG